MNRLKRIAATCLAFFIATTSCFAVDLDREIDFNIPAQKLDLALVEFSRQAKLQVITSGADIQSLETEGATGRYTISRALLVLLRSSGLSFKAVGDSAVSIGRFNSAHTQWTTETAAAQGTNGYPHFAQAERQSEAATLASQGSEARHQDRVAIDEIVVVGSRLKRTGDGPSPVIVFDREKIKELGASSISEVLRTLPQNPTELNENSRSISRNSTSVINLRGLPAENTLVLINGRRAQNAALNSGSSFDFSMLPISAVERIEVLADSASAIYGADALGGAINIKLRNDFQGFETALKYGNSFRTDVGETRASVAAGHTFSRGHVMAVVDYFTRNSLELGDVPTFNNQDFRRFGGADLRSAFGNPGNVTAVPGTGNLPGLNSNIAAIPAGQDGRNLTIADFQATAGQENRESIANTLTIIPEAERKSAFIAFTYDVGASIRLFGEGYIASSRSFLELFPGFASDVTVPAANPYNPFGVAVRADWHAHVDELPPTVEVFETDVGRYLLGLNTRLGGDWEFETAFLYQEDDSQNTNYYRFNEPRFQAHLNTVTGPDALNLFGDGAVNDPDLMRSFADSRLSTFAVSARTVDARFTGSLFQLPAGPVQMVLGAEHRQEDFDTVFRENNGPPVPASTLSGDRSVSAAFVEFGVPLIEPTQAVRVAHSLDAQLAARYDRYSDFGDTLNPKVGIAWRVIPGLLIRSSYSTSFRAPSLADLNRPAILAATGVNTADPFRGLQIYPMLFINGGNPDLEPEEGEMWMAGVNWRPPGLDEFSASVDYWNLTQTNTIATLTRQALLLFEDAFPGRVTRGPTLPGDPPGFRGRVTVGDVTALNFGGRETDGVDIAVDYGQTTSIGRFRASLLATWTFSYKEQLSPDVPVADRLDQVTSLTSVPYPYDFRASASLAWSRGGWSLGTVLRFTDQAIDLARDNVTRRTLDSSFLCDVNGAYEFDAPGFLEGVTIRGGIQNVFDQSPAFVISDNTTGMNMIRDNPRGRFGYLELTKRW